jgi:lysozyme
MTLRTTEHGIDLIKAFEGFKDKPYKCPAGIWTVGYGHTSAAGGPLVTVNGPVVSQAEAIAILHSDIDGFEDQVERLVQGVDLADHQFDALVSFAFNAGMANLKASTLLKKVKAGDFEGAAAQFARWNKFTNPATGQKDASPGLTRRRRAEAALFQGDLEDCQTYMGMDFGPMPQAVAQPDAPKTMAQSKTGNTSIVGAVGTAVLGAKAALDNAQAVVAPVQQVTQAAQSVTQQVQTTAEQGQAAVTSAQATVSVVQHIVPHLALGAAAPWALLTLIVMTGFVYVWYDRRKKLTEEGV